jgi:L-aspartate oxidase
MTVKDFFNYDVIIVGTGIGGLYTALLLDEKLNVLLISKGKVENCNTIRAEGGIAAAIGENDSPELHREDTISAGGKLNKVETVKVFTTEVLDRIRELENMGFRFDRDENNKYILGLEGFHSVRRILHFNGDKIGEGIFNFLLKKVRAKKNISFLEKSNVTEIILDENENYRGIELFKDNKLYYFTSKCIVLASGGYAGIFKKSTNDPYVAGDLIAIAYRIGALVEDLEFVQFHPTVLFKDGFDPFLISEAVRGEGAILLNSKGEQFMKKYHQNGELASRDIVSRAIYEEIRQQKNGEIYLDMRKIGNEKIKKLFPNIYENCRLRGIDITRDKIPIHPAAHYSMGGVRTNLYGETNINGIYAVGEVACNGLHGANRLASNSLPEALVFGYRTAQKINSISFSSKSSDLQFRTATSDESNIQFPSIAELREKNWNYVGIERDGKELSEYKSYLEPYFFEAIRLKPENSRKSSARNSIIVSYLLAISALLREESRGAHFRLDFPDMKESFQKSLSLKKARDSKELFVQISYTERG